MEKENKLKEVNITCHINEVMSQTEIIQYFKNESSSSIELLMKLPELTNCTITKFEMILNKKKVVSKILEKEKAKEKYSDSITTGNYGFISYNEDNETSICLGNIPSKAEIELKTYYFGDLICNDLSYQASFPVIFPKFIIGDPKNKEEPEEYHYNKSDVKGTIYINTFSKLTRLVIKGSSNFTKIEKKYSNDYKSAEIEFYKNTFNETDIPGIILFRTEKINEDILYNQYDPIKNLNYFLLQKTYEIPEINIEAKNQVDEDENIKYMSLLKKDDKIENQIGCYIFLIDQSGSMAGESIDLCSKALLLFLKSLNPGSYFQLIGFGSNYEYFSKEPLEYTKENIKNFIDIIKNLNASKGGTDLYKPLKNIFENSIYDKFKLKKEIFLLTDGEIDDKGETLNLIGAHSNKFSLHSLGIGDCDLDLIIKSAIMGNGFSYFISNLEELNKNIIQALENSQKLKKIETHYENNYKEKTFLEYNQNSICISNNYLRYEFILKEKINDIEIIIKAENKEQKINFNKDNIKHLPDGDKLGKIIVDNYLKVDNKKDEKERIKLSKDFCILTDNTAFYAEIQNEEPITDKMITYTNENKKAENNDIKDKNNSIINENNFELKDFGYEEIIHREQDNTNNKKKGFFSNFFSNLFSKKNEIIKKKSYKYKSPKISKMTKRAIMNIEKECCYEECGSCEKEYGYECDSCPMEDYIIDYDRYRIDFDREKEDDKEDGIKIVEKKVKKEEVKKILNFDELIISQDAIDGNWDNNEETKILIKEENTIYEKIKKYSEDKGIKEENGIITILVLYYIYNKKISKIEELKFVINKAKAYIKKIYGVEYEDVLKTI